MSIYAVPRLPPGLANRPRIAARLEGPAALVVLHAPAGYGKTAALTQWATTSGRTGVWFRVREGTSEPAAFVQELSAQLDDAGLLDERNPLRTAAESLTLMGDPWSLLGRGLRRIPGPLTLVLDEAEHLADATIAGVLELLHDLPSLSVRVATRRADRFTEPGLSLSLDADVLGPAEFALTPAEATAVLGPEAPAEVVAHVLEHGASPALARIVGFSGHAVAGGGGDAVEAAVTSLLRLRSSTWDGRFGSFLGRISLSEVVDVRLARELTSDPEPGKLLDRAEAEGLGYWSSPGARDRQGALFVPSPVFRRILAASTRRRMPGRVVRELDARIARWNLDGERPFPALQAAVRSRDANLVTEVVRLHWYDLFRHAEEVRELFRTVSPLTLRTQPLPSMLLAILWNARGAHRLRALEYFALAAYGARVQRSAAAPADRALLAAIESAAHRVSGRTDQSLRAALAGYDLLRTMTLDEREGLGRNESTIHNQIGLSLYYGGRFDDALECFRRSDAIGLERGLQTGLQGLAHAAGILAIAGRMREAAELAATASARRWPDGWQDGYAGSLLQLARALLALEDDDTDAAAAHLSTLEPHRPTIEHWAVLEQVHALCLLLQGEPHRAARQLDAVERAQQHRRAVGTTSAERWRVTRALVELARGDAAAADRVAAALAPGAVRAVSRARIRLATGDTRGTLQVLSTASATDEDPRLRGEHLSLTAAALALESGGAADAGATSALHRLQDHLREHGLTLPLAFVPVAGLAAMRSVAAASDAIVDDDFLRALVRAYARGAIRSRPRGPRLTQRELIVAQALTSGDTIAQIAADLSVSPNTIKSQLRAIYRKLDVSTREEAVRVLAAQLHDDSTADEDQLLR
jgi:LuxR family maltose regulon positive regulatory protein